MRINIDKPSSETQRFQFTPDQLTDCTMKERNQQHKHRQRQ